MAATKSKAAPKRRSKYNNTKVEVDGILFDSKKEGDRWLELKNLAAKGLIRNLEPPQVSFDLVVNEILVCRYIADFVYEARIAGRGWVRICEDVKGWKGGPNYRVFRLKQKLLQACHRVDIKEF
jgi:hypothetical protein